MFAFPWEQYINVLCVIIKSWESTFPSMYNYLYTRSGASYQQLSKPLRCLHFTFESSNQINILHEVTNLLGSVAKAVCSYSVQEKKLLPWFDGNGILLLGGVHNSGASKSLT